MLNKTGHIPVIFFNESVETKGAFFWDYSGIGILGIDSDRVLLEHKIIPFSE